MATRGPALERDGGEATARAELALNYGQAWTGRPHARSWRSTSKACFIECVRCTQLMQSATSDAGASESSAATTLAARRSRRFGAIVNHISTSRRRLSVQHAYE